ncbi:MAG: metalloregulator ArsR/SmtB family transcription factor [Chloroflexi bacterium]|nr:metalloregulator ArsR/SmtB family transcription factor [Chloroflexota bacterium]
MDEVFRALSDPTRRAVVRLLREEGPITAGDIADRFDLAKSTMSGHFAVLKQAGLLVAERQGTRVVYGLSLSVFEETVDAVMELLGGAKVRPAKRERKQ